MNMTMIKEIQDLKQAECVDTSRHHGHSGPHFKTNIFCQTIVQVFIPNTGSQLHSALNIAVL